MTAIVFALVTIIELSPQTTITKEVKKETVDCRQKKNRNRKSEYTKTV
jgi:hypothetical protein